jgi:hypothetical protein
MILDIIYDESLIFYSSLSIARRRYMPYEIKIDIWYYVKCY